jgi:hypothetical protein
MVLSISAQSQITKELHKSFRPELDNHYTLNVPYGTKVEQITTKSNTVQLQYIISVNTDEVHIADFLFKNFAPSPVLIDGFVEGQIDISMVMAKEHIFIAGKDIEIRVDRIRVLIPESIDYFAVKEAGVDQLLNN